MDKADLIYVYNRDGYIGVNTTLELGYAACLKKPIYAYERDTSEICRNILFDGYLTNLEEIIQILES
jgi:nucleoside 2-deoxyribosyltransferase